jgi:predicted enzyme related to lactoylglutathione lyase
MITGAHALLYVKDAEKVRAFFRDVLQFPSVDAGHGWLIFALPPAELGIHPTSEQSFTELYLMCDDLDATMRELNSRGVEFVGPVRDENWGRLATFRVPGGEEMWIYQPKHPTALGRWR